MDGRPQAVDGRETTGRRLTGDERRETEQGGHQTDGMKGMKELDGEDDNRGLLTMGNECLEWLGGMAGEKSHSQPPNPINCSRPFTFGL